MYRFEFICELAGQCDNDNCNHYEPHEHLIDECTNCHCSWIGKTVTCVDAELQYQEVHHNHDMTEC